jgi:general L-amino acid transport system substrate-binding protein
MKSILALGAALALAGAAQAAASPTLEEVKKRGVLLCGVSDGLMGFSNPDASGDWKGIDADTCRAIAAAIFDDASKVRFVSLTSTERFTVLTSGGVDVLPRNTTITMGRDAGLNMDFTHVTYYDGQGFMVKAETGITNVSGLNGATICTQAGTTTELNVADHFSANGWTFNILTFEKENEALAAYQAGQCDAYTTDASGLYGGRLELGDPAAHTILPEIISKEPLAPAVRENDSKWADLVRWVQYAQINAEELGVTQANVQEKLAAPSPEIRRLLGVDGDFGQQIGLTNDWAVRVIRAVGNYGEMFERNLGQGSELKIERGLNALWSKGGLQYAPPVR